MQDEIGQFFKDGYTARQDLCNLASKGLDGFPMQAVQAMEAMPRSKWGAVWRKIGSAWRIREGAFDALSASIP